jgi:aromatic-L-amino-acid/L-tryptophan decarboxylase
LVKTLAIRPEFLKTHGRDGILNYSEWSIPLGRRFRALKIWFLLRAHGLEGLRTMIRDHVAWSRELAEAIAREPGFEIVTQPMLSLFTFRHVPHRVADLDAHNIALVNAINDDGRIFLTQTNVDGRIAIRFQVGSFETTRAHVMGALDIIRENAARLSPG